MPLTHISDLEAPDTRALPFRILESTLELLKKLVHAFYHSLVFLVDLTAMVTTLGLPYLHYRIYRHKRENEAYSGEMYSHMIGALGTLWDTYSYISLPISPLPFPMVSSSGLPLCSTASFLAVMTLIIGVFSVATCTIYKLKFRALHNERIVDEWWKASQKPWHQVPNKSFWVLLSLPTFVFFLSVVLLIATATLSVWERPVDGMAPNAMEMRGCPIDRLRAFKNILFATLVAAIIHFVFIISKMYSMAVVEATVVAAV